MFGIHKSDTGAVPPWEYMEAADGTYKAGQLVTVADGKIIALSAASTTTPPYLCMANAVVAGGGLLPVVRMSKDYIYSTILGAAATSAKVGSKLQVAKDGLTVNASAEGTFEVVYLEGTAAGNVVHGRWV